MEGLRWAEARFDVIRTDNLLHPSRMAHPTDRLPRLSGDAAAARLPIGSPGRPEG